MKNNKLSISRLASRVGTLLLLMIGLLYISAHVSLIYPMSVSDKGRSFFYTPNPKKYESDKQALKNDFFLEQRRDIRVRAFLNMIAYAEGTLGSSGYRMHYAGELFYDFSDHPRQVICATYGSTGKQLCSSAAGRYQFLQKTWDYLAPKIDAPNFGPLHQDRAAIFLLDEKKALDLIKRGDIESAIERVNKTWASFPGSPYGQRTYSLSHLKDVYYENIRLLGGRV